MATYSSRSSQRLRRNEPTVASSSRHAASSSREGAQANASTSRASQVSSVDDNDGESQEDYGRSFLSRFDLHKLNVTERAQRIAEQMGQSEIDKKAAELARYALACEYQRSIIRKDDIAKVITDGIPPGAFNVVFNAAQEKLQSVFGMAMVEVRKKGADNAELAKQAKQVLRAAEASANGLRPRNQQRELSPTSETGPSSNQWVLRSNLFPELWKSLSNIDEELTNAYAESIAPPSSASSAQRRPSTSREPKAALDWKSADHQDGEMGLLYIILALILVNGRTITEATLYMYLRRLHLDPQKPLPSALRGTGPSLGSTSTGSQSTQTQSRTRAMQGTLEGFLNAMVKQSYLEKQRSDVGIDHVDAAINQAQTQSRRRGRTSGAAGADDETTVWEWKWGGRAEVEVGERNIAKMIAHIFTDPSATQNATQAVEEEDEETREIDRNRLAKRRKMLLANIESVAGSKLVN
ncbi:hypothetical protein NDA16_002179 [Ustilago loliicola]|nr:hypothetical protein NDA16_002179 [Ustilago loliicola]